MRRNDRLLREEMAQQDDNWQQVVALMQGEIKALRAQHAAIPQTVVDRFTQGAAISAAINSS